MSQRITVHALVLGAFCLGFGTILALTDKVTSEEIKLRTAEDLQASLVQVIPPGIHDNNPVQDAVILKGEGDKDITVYRAMKNGQVTGVAYEISGIGYAGEVKLIMGVDPEGKILGVRATEHKETPGLGDKIEPKKTNWILRFTGLSLGNPAPDQWKVKKDGGVFDQFSGATITPRGVVGAIRTGLEFYAAHKAQMLETH